MTKTTPPMTDFEKRSIELLEQIATDIRWLREHAEEKDRDDEGVVEVMSEAVKSLRR